MSEIIMSLEAKRLCSSGYVIMPVQRNKQPYPSFNWKFLQKLEKQSEEQVKRWWIKYKDSNIALITGTVVFAIDADTKEAIQWVESNLPTTPAVSITGKGKHYLYRMPNFHIGNSVNRELGLDIRGTNGYIVAPPSLHENGNRYTWENEFLGPNDLPELQKEQYKILYEGTRNKSLEQFASKRETLVINKPLIKKSDDDYRDLRPLFNEIASKLNKSSRNGEDSVKACCPAHEDRNPSFIASLSPKGDVLMNCFSGCSFESICDSLGIEAKDCMSEKPRNQEASLNVNEILSDFKIKEDNKKELIFNKENIANEEELKCPEFEKKWLRPPGLVGELCDYINETSIRHQPLLALGAALTAIGTLFGRKVQSENGVRTNLYIVGVAKTGGGKERGRKAIKKCFTEAGLFEKYMGGEQFASDTGIIVECERIPSILYQIDEFGKYLQSLFNKNAGGHITNIITLLMSLYEKADDTFAWKQYADKKRERIILDQPNVSIYGTTVSNNFWEGFTKEQAIDGFLNRIIVFQSNTVPKKNKSIYSTKPVSKSIVDQFIKADKTPYYHSSEPFDNGVLNELRCEPKVLPFNEGARDLFNQFDEEIEEITNTTSKEQDTIEKAMFRRCSNIAERIALNIAAGRWLDHVDEESMIYGINIARISTKISYHNVMRSVADNLTEQNVLKILSIIKDAGSNGIAKSQLVRKTQNMTRMIREDAISTLIDGEQILPHIKKTGTKSSTIYYPSR